MTLVLTMAQLTMALLISYYGSTHYQWLFVWLYVPWQVHGSLQQLRRKLRAQGGATGLVTRLAGLQVSKCVSKRGAARKWYVVSGKWHTHTCVLQAHVPTELQRKGPKEPATSRSYHPCSGRRRPSRSPSPTCTRASRS